MARRASSMARPTGSSTVASSQLIPGSERNQVRWRLEKATVRLASSSMACVTRQLSIEDRPGFAIADRREGGQGRIEALPESAGLLEQASIELGTRPGGDSHGVWTGLDGQAEPERRPGISARRWQWLVAVELGHLQGADHPARVPQLDPGRERRCDGLEAFGQGFQTTRDQLRLETGS